MPGKIVVVTFYSRGGTAEKLATLAAVGCVQKRAGIRMRRVPDTDAAAALQRYSDAADSLRRMHGEYVAPREVDVLAADALIFASPADVEASAPEWSPYVELLQRLGSEDKLTGKVGAVVSMGRSAESFASMIQRVGMVLVTPDAAMGDAEEDVARAIALGRRTVETTEASKAGN